MDVGEFDNTVEQAKAALTEMLAIARTSGRLLGGAELRVEMRVTLEHGKGGDFSRWSRTSKGLIYDLSEEELAEIEAEENA